MGDNKETAFSMYHPIVCFTYFIVMISASMFFMHPVFIGISLVCSFTYTTLINKGKSKQILIFGLITAICIAIVNAIFVHRGATVLFYLKDNPITFESIIYGTCSGAMMLSVILWFSAYNEVITTDKFLYIFSKIVPSISLMLSMTIRLIPKLIQQTKVIVASQKTVGLDCSSGNIINRAKSSMRVLSILVTWALEDGVQTADSMKARGYGLKGRTTFSIFIFTFKDKIMTLIIMLVSLILVIGYLMGLGTLRFYPTIANITLDIKSLIIYISFFIIGLLPSMLELLEVRKWKLLK